MKTTEEMMKEILELKKSKSDSIHFDVDKTTEIFVEILADQNGGALQILLAWRNINTGKIFELVMCEYDDNEDIKISLNYIRSYIYWMI